MTNRGSFGFKNINGKAIKLIVEKKISNKFMDKNTPKRLQKFVVRAMNKAGRKAQNRAKNPNWTPMLTRALIDSIRWEKAKLSARGNIIRGLLTANTPYARRQEFEHKTKGAFLRRAVIQIAQPDFIARLRKKGIYEKLFIGGIGFGG